MLKIRLQRTGRIHEPTFRLILTDSKNSTKSGRAIEVLGSHDFRKTNTEINAERVKYWMSQGAKPTDTVHNLLISEKVIEGKKINVLPKKTVEKKEEPTIEAAPAAEPTTAEAPTETSAEATQPPEKPTAAPEPTPEPAAAPAAEPAPAEAPPAPPTKDPA
ncbi:MAG TPA: 30S ribosomal protein S16 [Candidatus Paceibacterota bacterium]|nr:30S ribosomal protein S16 [Candidatus Paceibacterota bacterium]